MRKKRTIDVCKPSQVADLGKSNNLVRKIKKKEQTRLFPKLLYLTDVDTLRTLIRKKQVRVVDVRKKEDYVKEHIRSAVSIPLSSILEADSPEKIVNIIQLAGISDEMPVVIYDNTFGALAARVAWTFEYVGHKNTSLLEVTFDQWKKQGLETENRVHDFGRAHHSFNINNEIYADAEYVENSKTRKDRILVDSRERLNFLTEHIPGATNIPYTMLGTSETILRTPTEIKRFMENRNIESNLEVITYCGSVGTLSGLAYYALKIAGVNKVKLYSKSFKDWKKLGKPIDEFNDANYWDLSAE
ncbi:MAG TPA: rhodanese-like domain-containing protein [Nitrososphaeraceae archaeon]